MELTPEYYKALLPFRNSPQTPDDPPEIYDDLISCGWISAVGCTTMDYNGSVQVYDNCWAITPQGRMALAAYEKSVKHDADEKRQNRITNYFSAINIGVSVFSFVLGLLADHYFGVVAFVEAFFHLG